MMETAKAKGVPDGPAALIGLSGLQKAIVLAIQLIRPDTRVFDGLEDAKDWIVSRLQQSRRHALAAGRPGQSLHIMAVDTRQHE